MKICKLICLVCSLLFVVRAEALEFKYGELAQGGVVHGNVLDADKIKVGNRSFVVDTNGDFLMAFEREAPSSVVAEVMKKNGSVEKITINVKPTQWDIQKINGIPQKKVTPPAEDLAAINDERTKVRNAVAIVSENPYWKNGFVQPTHGRISGKFGGQRVMNGRKMNPHNGTDIAAVIGTPVVASGDGVVVLTAKNLFYTGNVVIVDHGYGLQTIYAHLDKILVENGQKVSKGELIGKVGKTGRVSGPHLHWGATLNGIRFNPFTLLNLANSEKTTQVVGDFTK